MRLLTVFLFLVAAIAAGAQSKLTPGKNVIENKWVRNETTEMLWYAFRDTVKAEIGKVVTAIRKEGKRLIVTTEVKMKNSSAQWIDSTIADIVTLRPVRHASYNAQRDMALDFGNPVTGYYKDKINNKTIYINDSTSEPYFDSNLYSTMISWLPLREGYSTDIPIYDYNPAGKSGISTVSVLSVKSGSYETGNSGSREVWIVNVSSEIGGSGNSMSTYFIDKSNRQLLKQEMVAGKRKMMMERVNAD